MASELSNGTTIPHATSHQDLLTKLRTFVESTLPIAERYTVNRYIGETYDSISSITSTSTTVTVTHTGFHLLDTGDRVTISGADQSAYNGNFQITVTGPTTYTYTALTIPSASPATGTLVENREALQILWTAPGLSGTEEIYLGIKTYKNVSLDYYNWSINAFTGYLSTNSFNTQPGRVSYNIGVPLYETTIPYLFDANGQRIVISANIATKYQSMYLGKYLPYATPSQMTYPVCVGGMLPSDSATRYDDASITSWFKGERNNFTMWFFGSWRTPQLMPYYSVGIHTLRNTKSDSNNDEVTEPGYYGLHAIILSENTPGFVNDYGELDGVYFISGFANAAENTVTIGADTYYIIRDVSRTGFEDYLAIKMS